MKYIEFNDHTKLSRLGMGAMRLPEKKTSEGMIIDEEKAEKIIDYAIENGINYFDTAYIYHKGESEGFLGKALKKYNREKYYIADKFHLLSNPDYKKQFEEQLCRLETEYIDFYLLHGVRGFTLDKYINSGCIEYFDQLKKAGKIKNLGFSFHGGPEHLKKMMKVYDWDFVQLQLNCFDWKYGDAESIYNVLKDVNIPIMVMEPLRGGLIAKKNEKIQGLLNKLKKGTTAVELAMRWLVDFPQVTVILSGMSEIDQLKENIRIMSDLKKLEDNEREVLSDICDILKKEVAVLCTNCRYCVNACPLSLNIPKLLEIYNEIQFNGIKNIEMLGSLPDSKQPEKCIGCGECTKNCPQGFKVPCYIKKLEEIKFAGGQEND